MIDIISDIFWKIALLIKSAWNHIKGLRFRVGRGFWRWEAFSTSAYTVDFMIPRLKYMRDNAMGHPIDMTYEEWISVLDEIIWALEAFKEDDVDSIISTRFKNAEKLIAEHFFHLWD